ncbi:pilus assembly protein TadG-related protein [Micromonospora sp. DT81.3]|uniref:pilus assembly protein TadG-related protein n=1 Tax=Micromonospora sp. DT81.3 TaxID=3416523 RepID=UPI003CEE53D4
MLRPRVSDPDEEGSILLLTLGYAMLAIVAILVCVNATSLYLAQKRLDSLADAAALAGADGFSIGMSGGEPHAELRDDAVFTQASEIVDAVGDGAILVSAGTPDGLSARVSVATVWQAPIVSLFVPEGVRLASTATSRTALR